jgi:AcrR family transcriptional regulator
VLLIVATDLEMGQSGHMTTSAPQTARQRARAELTSEIKEVARRQLAEHGSAALSLRAVARELGMVSSAVYRYFPSRDDLLTALIVDAYDAVGAAVEEAEARVRRSGHVGRWLAACRALRSWAVENPHQYALIFGSPVPGYAAPTDTIDPAARVPLVLLEILHDSVASHGEPADTGPPLPRPVRAELRAFGTQLEQTLSERMLAMGIMAWTQLIGAVSFELFGHLQNVIDDHDAFFDLEMRAVAGALGLAR